MHIDPVPQIKTPPVSPFRQAPVVEPVDEKDHTLDHLQLGEGVDDLPDYLKQEIL